MTGLYKMLQVRPPTIIKQRNADESITWLLDGIGKKRGQSLIAMGCKWVRGKPGCWEITPDVALMFSSRGVSVIDYSTEHTQGV